MNDSAVAAATICSLPCSKLYWAVLEVPAGCSVGRVAGRLVASRSPVLELMLADWVPMGTDALAGAFVAIDDRRVVACCCDRSVAVEALRRGVMELYPDEIPGFVAEAAPGVCPEEFNLLIGPLEAPARRASRRAWRVVIAATGAVAAGLVWLGVERRLARDERIQADVAAAAGGRSVSELRAEVSRLERVTAARPEFAGDRDAGVALATLLASWPSGTAVRVELITVGPAAIAVNALAAGSSDVEALVAALRDVSGWTMVQPQANSVGGQTRLNLRWLRSASSVADGGAP